VQALERHKLSALKNLPGACTAGESVLPDACTTAPPSPMKKRRVQLRIVYCANTFGEMFVPLDLFCQITPINWEVLNRKRKYGKYKMAANLKSKLLPAPPPQANIL
jgi:hypothetical protein